MPRHFRPSVAALALAPLLAGAPAFAEEPPDLAKFDCVRTDDGKSTPGDQLARQGFEIASRARFGNANLMMIEPKSSVRANCFLRSPK